MIRVFGSKDCPACKELEQVLKAKSASYVFVDGLDEKNDELCDMNGVNDFPHVQIITGGKIAYNAVRPELKDVLQQLENYDSTK